MEFEEIQNRIKKIIETPIQAIPESIMAKNREDMEKNNKKINRNEHLGAYTTTLFDVVLEMTPN